MAKKIIITFDTIHDAGEYIVEKLVAQGKKFTYRAVGIMGTPEVELEPTDAELDGLLRKPGAEPNLGFVCRSCDFWSAGGLYGTCTKHNHPSSGSNTCVDHSFDGQTEGRYTKVQSSDWRSGNVYGVRIFPDGTGACDCPAFKFQPDHRPCKHIMRVVNSGR